MLKNTPIFLKKLYKKEEFLRIVEISNFIFTKQRILANSSQRKYGICVQCARHTF